MDRKKGLVLASLGLVILLMSIVLSAPGKGQAAAPPADRDVRVINTPGEAVPVAVQGTTAVTGAVSLTGTSNVAVTNTSASPVPVAPVNDPALQPWQYSFSLDMVDGEMSKMVFLPDPPLGKRLVLEFGSAELTVITGQMPSVQITGSVNGIGSATHVLAVTNVGKHAPLQDRWSGSHAMKIYVDNGYVRVTRAGSAANVFFGVVTLTGHLVNVP